MRLNTLQPKKGSRFTKSRKGKGHSRLDRAKHLVEGTKDRNQDLVVFIKLGLKGVKCLYKEDYLKEDLPPESFKTLTKCVSVICPR